MPKPGMRGIATSPEENWKAFTARAMATKNGMPPFRLSAGLRYTTEQGNSARVSALLWSNGKADLHPIRLDLSAGIGSLVAAIREDTSTFAAYDPGENVLYMHARGEHTLVSFGVPIPLTLSDLSLLLTGRCGHLFLPENTANAPTLPANRTASVRGTFFPLYDAALPGILEIGPNGALLSWREHKGNGWLMEFEPSKEDPLRPQKVRIMHPAGREALITLKSVSHPEAPFSPAQLNLAVPENARRRILETAPL